VVEPIDQLERDDACFRKNRFVMQLGTHALTSPLVLALLSVESGKPVLSGFPLLHELLDCEVRIGDTSFVVHENQDRMLLIVFKVFPKKHSILHTSSHYLFRVRLENEEISRTKPFHVKGKYRETVQMPATALWSIQKFKNCTQ